MQGVYAVVVGLCIAVRMSHAQNVKASDCKHQCRLLYILQFEDPAPGLQRLREKPEVDMLRMQPWVTEAADAALAAAQAAQLKQQAAAQALYQTAMSKKRQQAASQPAAEQLPNGLQQGPSLQLEQQPEMQGQPTTAEASDKSDTTATHKPGIDPVALLALPQQLQERITRELKIHKHQVGDVCMTVSIFSVFVTCCCCL